MVRTHLAIAFLLGVMLALSGALVVTAGRGGLPEASAQTSGNNDVIAMMGTMNTGKGPCDNFYIIDSKSMRMAVYSYNNSTLTLVDTRNLMYDLKPEQYGDHQTPSVKDMRDLTRQEDNHPGKK
jgi:hypothetical protein